MSAIVTHTTTEGGTSVGSESIDSGNSSAIIAHKIKSQTGDIKLEFRQLNTVLLLVY